MRIDPMREQAVRLRRIPSPALAIQCAEQLFKIISAGEGCDLQRPSIHAGVADRGETNFGVRAVLRQCVEQQGANGRISRRARTTLSLSHQWPRSTDLWTPC